MLLTISSFIWVGIIIIGIGLYLLYKEMYARKVRARDRREHSFKQEHPLSPEDCFYTTDNWSAVEGSLFEIINRYRAKNNIDPLVPNELLHDRASHYANVISSDSAQIPNWDKKCIVTYLGGNNARITGIALKNSSWNREVLKNINVTQIGIGTFRVGDGLKLNYVILLGDE